MLRLFVNVWLHLALACDFFRVFVFQVVYLFGRLRSLVVSAGCVFSVFCSVSALPVGFSWKAFCKNPNSAAAAAAISLPLRREAPAHFAPYTGKLKPGAFACCLPSNSKGRSFLLNLIAVHRPSMAGRISIQDIVRISLSRPPVFTNLFIFGPRNEFLQFFV